MNQRKYMTDSFLIATAVNHSKQTATATVVDELALPNGASIVTKPSGEFLRWTHPNGTYKEVPIVFKGLDGQRANRLKHTLLDNYYLAGYDCSNPKPLSARVYDEPNNHILKVFLCPVTMMVHICSRDSTDPRYVQGIDWSTMTVKWPCDEDAGTYHIVKFGLSKDKGEELKRQLYAQYVEMGYTKVSARNQVPKYVRAAREISKQFAV
jgi:hypothetical protein